MEHKILNHSINHPNITIEMVKINKVGKTDVVLPKYDTRRGMAIDNFALPYYTLTREEQLSRRYVNGKFTEVCDRQEMNVVPGIVYYSDSEKGVDLHIEVIGVKDELGKESEKEFRKRGYDCFKITSYTERYPDGHGEFEFTDFVYDENGNTCKDIDGNRKSWSYRYDRYSYYYKVIGTDIAL